MKTRSQARREQSSRLVACSGVDSLIDPSGPGPHQGNAVVAPHIQVNSGVTVSVAANGDQRQAFNGNHCQTFNCVNNVNIVDNLICTDCFSPECNIRTCRNIRCKLCPQLVQSCKVKSTNTGRVFDLNLEPTVNASCKAANLIYLLTCNNCKLQYVGQTVQPLNMRINTHRSSILGKGCKLLSEHLSTAPCTDHGFSVQILQYLPGNGRLGIEEDLAQTRQRVCVEEEWMVKLRTVYPYGLNDKCNGMMWTEKAQDVYTARSLFTRLSRPNTFITRSIKSQKQNLPTDIILDQLENRCACPQNFNFDNPCAACTLDFARKRIPSLSKATAKKLGSQISEKIYGGLTTLPHQFYEVFIDLINSKFAPKTRKIPIKKSKPDVLLKVLFTDKHIQDLNISRILRDSEILKAIPPDFKFRKAPTLVYKHVPPIRNKNFNYSEETQNFDLESFKMREMNNENNCSCQNSPFKDPDHGHIITGDLSLVENQDLRKLLELGPNFREQKSKTNFNHIWKNVSSGISNCIESWARKENAPVEELDEWKVKLLCKLKQSLQKIKKNPRKIPMEVLKQTKNIEDLENLHSKFIVLFVDKASNNVALVCKNYYFRVLMNELGLNQTENSTYEAQHLPEKHFVDIQKRFLNETSPGLPCVSDQLPFIYAVPKLHKNPVKFRFLVSQRKCPLKLLNQTLSKICKLTLKQHRAWCRTIYKFSGINRMWIADNFDDVLNKINAINTRTKAISTKQYDFSTLYTSLPIQYLIDQLNWCFEKAYIGGKKKFISIYSSNAKFVQNPKEGTLSFTLEKLKDVFKFIVEHAYFRFGDTVLLQKTGIMMGWDAAPHVANLALYASEHKFQEKMSKENFHAAKQNNKNSRFIDDINTLNNRVFDDQIKQIYPTEITCNRENLTDISGHFLEVDITVKNDKFVTKIFDKRDDFNFKIVKFPHIKSNIPDCIVFNVFVSQIIRIARVCSDFQEFKDIFKVLILNFKGKGCSNRILFQKAKKVFLANTETFSKFDLTLKDFLSSTFSSVVPISLSQ